MPVINFERAIELITRAYKTATEKRKYSSPFFYIVGSGVSADSIPLASEMVKQFAMELNKPEADLDKNIQSKYSEYFEELYYEPTERRDYLYDIMDSATITEANFMLAHLLIKKTNFSNLVITTNFDNLLTRALNLFGAEPLVFDHPNSIERINTSVKDKIQIVHVHGSFRFYDCCNLDYEIHDRASANRTYYSSVYNYLMNVLSESSPIIIGYGGWEDVVIKAIKQRLESSVGYHYYWFCFDEKSYLQIDEELKASPYIFFVVNDRNIVKQESYLDYHQKLQEKHREVANLPATKVLDKLKTALNTQDLELFNEPLIFFKQQLDKLFPKSIDNSFYSFEKVRLILDNAISADLPGDVDLSAGNAQINKFKGEIQALGRKGQYKEIIQKIDSEYFSNNKINKLMDDAKTDMAEFLYASAVNLKKIAQSQMAYTLFSKILTIEDKKISKLREIKSHAWYEKARLDLDLHGPQKAIESHTKLIEEFSKDNVLVCRENVARALYALGYVYDTKSNFVDALTPYHKIIEKFEQSSEGSLKINVANAYLCLGRNYSRIAAQQGSEHEQRGTYEKALQMLRTLINNYSGDERMEFKKVVGEAKRQIAAIENTMKPRVRKKGY